MVHLETTVRRLRTFFITATFLLHAEYFDLLTGGSNFGAAVVVVVAVGSEDRLFDAKDVGGELSTPVWRLRKW